MRRSEPRRHAGLRAIAARLDRLRNGPDEVLAQGLEVRDRAVRLSPLPLRSRPNSWTRSRVSASSLGWPGGGGTPTERWTAGPRGRLPGCQAHRQGRDDPPPRRLSRKFLEAQRRIVANLEQFEASLRCVLEGKDEDALFSRSRRGDRRRLHNSAATGPHGRPGSPGSPPSETGSSRRSLPATAIPSTGSWWWSSSSSRSGRRRDERTRPLASWSRARISR